MKADRLSLLGILLPPVAIFWGNSTDRNGDFTF